MKLYVEHELISDFFKGFSKSELKEVLREIQLLVSKELDIEFIDPPSDDKDREHNFIDSLSIEKITYLNSFIDIAVLEIQNILDDSNVELTNIERVEFSDTVLVFHLKAIQSEDKEEDKELDEEEEDDLDDDEDD